MYKIMQAAIFSLSVHLWKLQNYYQYHDSKSMNYKQEKEVQQMQETYPLCQTKSQFDIMGMFPTFTESMKPWSLTQVDIMDMHIREDTHKKNGFFQWSDHLCTPTPLELSGSCFFYRQKKSFFLCASSICDVLFNVQLQYNLLVSIVINYSAFKETRIEVCILFFF